MPFPLSEKPFAKLLVWFIGLDLVLIGVNIVLYFLHKFGSIAEVPVFFQVTQDWSLPEIYNYVKWLAIFAALLWLFLQDFEFVPLLWAAIYFLIFLDDAFQIHETTGAWLSTSFSIEPRADLSGSDIGELAYFGLMGSIVLMSIALAFWRGNPAWRRLSIHMTLCLVALTMFGAVIDALHQVIASMTAGMAFGAVVASIAGLIEDGGEMIVASVALAVVLAFHMRTKLPGLAEVTADR